MKVLVVGATGVVGRQVVPLLTAAGYDVYALARAVPPASRPRGGAVAWVPGDVLDADRTCAVIGEIRPDAIVHMATAIPRALNPRRFAAQFELTNRIRTAGTHNLIEASRPFGPVKLISQGVAFAYDPAGDGLAQEDSGLWRDPPAPFAPALAALRDLERQTVAASGTVLRFGHLCGPGTGYAADGAFSQQVRDRKVPIVGGGTSTFSFTHAHDAATAILAALEGDITGPLNIVDDEPVQIAEWLPALATALDAKSPRRLPPWVARLATGDWGVAFMTQLRGASNAKAKASLHWEPLHATWRSSLLDEVAPSPSPAPAAQV